MSPGRVVIVGAGVTGLAAACELARGGTAVDLLSLVPARRGVVASSGDALAAARPGDADAIAAHADDATPRGADRTEVAVIRALVAAAPRVVARFAAAGVTFATGEGEEPARRRASGHRRDRLVSAGPSTKRQIVEALDRELAAFSHGRADRVRRLEGWEVVALVLHEGRCVGVVAQDLRTMEIHAIPALAVLLASGGFAGAWASSTAAPSAVGSATAAAVRAGAVLAAADAVDLAPLAIATRAKRHAVSDSLRAAGARVWVPVDPRDPRRGRDVPGKERRDLLRELDEAAGHLVAPSVAARAIAKALRDDGAGIFDVATDRVAPFAHLDVGHLAGAMSAEARAEVDRLWRIAGVDLDAAPAPIAPAVSDTLGGIEVGFELDPDGALIEDAEQNHATAVPGLFAAGSAAFAYHRDARLPGHRLLEALVGGERAARAIVTHGARRDARDVRNALEQAEADARDAYASILARPRGEPVHEIATALGEALDALVGLGPPAPLATIRARIDAIAERAAACGADDPATTANRGAPAVRRLEAAALLARRVVEAVEARPSDARTETARVEPDPPAAPLAEEEP